MSSMDFFDFVVIKILIRFYFDLMRFSSKFDFTWNSSSSRVSLVLLHVTLIFDDFDFFFI